MLTAFVLLGWAVILLVSGDDEATRVRKVEDVARFEVLVPLAEGGDTQAQYALGRLYQQGRGLARDAQAAAGWYAKAANKGHAAARHALGKLHENGEGVKRDYYRASEWYRLAADIGNYAEAQFALGELYFHGRGVSHDYGEAVKWYLKATRQGYAAAQFVVGAMLQEGWGLKRDYVEAYTCICWLWRGAAKRWPSMKSSIQRRAPGPRRKDEPPSDRARREEGRDLAPGALAVIPSKRIRR